MRIQAEGLLRASEDQQRIRDLEQQLDAANQRIAALEAHLRHARSDSSFFEDRLAMHGALDRKRIEELTQRAEAAERNLAVAMDALKAHEEYCCSSEEQCREYFYNRFAQLKYKALAQDRAAGG